MMCQHCVATVTKTLEGIDGAQNVRVDLDGKCADLDVPPSVSDDTLSQRITDAGYEVKGIASA